MWNRSSEGNPSDRRGPSQSPKAVALFIDYEGLQVGFEAAHGGSVEPAALAQRIFSHARGEGRVVMGRAYADWTQSDDAAREFRRNHIDPVLALSKEGGESRSTMEMALEIQRLIYEGPPVDVVVIGAGDSHLHSLFRLVRASGREIVLACPRGAAGRELVLTSDRIRWLDDLLHEWPDEDEPLDEETYNWGPFVRLLDDLEANLEFVGLNYLIRRVLDRGNCGYSDIRRKQEVVNSAQDRGIIEVYQVENKDQRGDPVSACRLVLEHPVVEEILEEEEGMD